VNYARDLLVLDLCIVALVAIYLVLIDFFGWVA